ncbi:cytochrome P450 [Ascobolus immersus RN42]|uniref:Cytochrome P450 n=1 Tax=Ascobolus immersus RN42 TaxID=1160509 RepID=A0A3N4IG73_ASCIM|nr:cytochrome P450 [Ascobolus immersus RN42]
MSWQTLILGALGFWLVKRIVLTIYRLYFHPLARFPGPPLARASTFYQFWCEMILPGVFNTRTFDELHPKFGPIVRTGPNRLHFSDPAVFHQIHYTGSPFPKDPAIYGTIGPQGDLFSLVDPKEHRQRRKMLSPMFSRSQILKVEPMVRNKVGILLDRIDAIIDGNDQIGGRKEGEFGWISMQKPFQAMVADIVMEFTLFQSYNALSEPNFENPLIIALFTITTTNRLFRHFPLLFKLPQYLPLWLVNRLSPVAFELANWQVQLRKHLQTQLALIETQKFHKRSYNVLLSSVLDQYPSDLNLLTKECTSIVIAGIVTTPLILTHTLYRLALDPTLQARLLAELKSALPTLTTELDLQIIEKLPLLRATLLESLRLAYGIVAPLSRLTPPAGATLAGQPIPPGTAVDISCYAIHHNEELFPDSFTFNPERWMQGEKSKRLEKYIVSFGGGSRACLGMQLAWGELYLAVAGVVRRFEVTTTREVQEGGWEWEDQWSAEGRGVEKVFGFRRRGE